jgi:hypothetical protein
MTLAELIKSSGYKECWALWEKHDLCWSRDESSNIILYPSLEDVLANRWSDQEPVRVDTLEPTP